MAIEPLPEGTHIRMRVIRRYASYNVGDVIALSLGAAQEAYAKRLVTPVGDMLVPVVAAAATEPVPQRAPAATVRK